MKMTSVKYLVGEGFKNTGVNRLMSIASIGACFIGETAYTIKDGSVGHFPGGVNHPQVTAPGFPMYTVWMIRHLPGNPWLDRVDDERYMWLNDGQTQKFEREIK